MYSYDSKDQPIAPMNRTATTQHPFVKEAVQPESLLDEIKREVSEYSRRSHMKSFKMSHTKQHSKESNELRKQSAGQLESLPEEDTEQPPQGAVAQSSGSEEHSSIGDKQTKEKSRLEDSQKSAVQHPNPLR